MNQEESFHKARRAFIIIPDTGIVLAKSNSSFSHEEILRSIKISPEDIKNIIDLYPRGYFKDNTLMLYQGDFLPLSEENLDIMKNYFEDLKKLFNIDENTKIFSGLKKGKIGEIWQPLKRILL